MQYLSDVIRSTKYVIGHVAAFSASVPIGIISYIATSPADRNDFIAGLSQEEPSLQEVIYIPPVQSRSNLLEHIIGWYKNLKPR